MISLVITLYFLPLLFIDWQRLVDGKGSRVAFCLKDVSVFNEEDWDKMIDFMTSNIIKFEKAVKDVMMFL